MVSLILSVRYPVRIKEIMKHFICICGCNAPVIVRDYAVEMIMHAGSSVWPFRTAVPFNILKYRKLQFLQGRIAFAVCFFFFEVFERAFTAGVVKGIAFL